MNSAKIFKKDARVKNTEDSNNQSFQRFSSSSKSSILLFNAEPSRCGGEIALLMNFLLLDSSPPSSSSSKSSS